MKKLAGSNNRIRASTLRASHKVPIKRHSNIHVLHIRRRLDDLTAVVCLVTQTCHFPSFCIFHRALPALIIEL